MSKDLHAEQVAYWTGEGGENWLAREARLDAMIAALGQRAMAVAAAHPGEAVLDIGCGTGPTTRGLARIVGPDGSVTGLDLSSAMTTEATRRAEAEGLANTRFVVGDASVYPFEPGAFDLMFSRFGVMFFGDPAAAFSHLRRALKPDGRLVFLCWRSFKENPWALVPFMAGVPLLPPMPRPGPDDPGPFSFGDPERVRRILDAAGFAGLRIEPVHTVVTLSGGSLDETARLAMDFGPLARAMRDATPEAREKVAEAVRTALAPHYAEGAVRLAAACWLVRATNA
jgi:SAM-dependent methyltransferase